MKAKFEFPLAGIGYSVGIRLGLVAANLCIGVLLARILGPAEFGKYALLTTLILLASLVSSLGLPTIALRETSRLLIEEKFGELVGLLNFCLVCVLAATMFLSGLVYLASLTFFDLAPPIYSTTLLSVIAIVPAVALGTLLSDVLRGWGEIRIALAAGLLRQLMLLLGCTVILILNLFELFNVTLASVFGVYALSCYCTLGLLVWSVRKRVAPLCPSQEVNYRSRYWLTAGLPVLATACVQLINNRVDILMLGFLAESLDVGLYEVAMRGSELLIFAPVAVSIALAAEVAKLSSGGNQDQLQFLISRAQRLVVPASVALFLLLFCFGSELIGLVFGAEYSAAAAAMRTLLIGHFVNVISGPSDLVLNMTRRESLVAKMVGVAAIVNVSLNYVLIPIWGITGAAVANAVGNMVWNLGLAFVCTKFVGVQTYLFWTRDFEPKSANSSNSIER